MAGEAATVVESFDALASSRRLQQAGFPMQQSDAIASELAGAISGLVTREHFDATLASLEARLRESQSRWAVTIITVNFAGLGLLLALLMHFG